MGARLCPLTPIPVPPPWPWLWFPGWVLPVPPVPAGPLPSCSACTSLGGTRSWGGGQDLGLGAFGCGSEVPHVPSLGASGASCWPSIFYRGEEGELRAEQDAAGEHQPASCSAGLKGGEILAAGLGFGDESGVFGGFPIRGGAAGLGRRCRCLWAHPSPAPVLAQMGAWRRWWRSSTAGR